MRDSGSMSDIHQHIYKYQGRLEIPVNGNSSWYFSWPRSPTGSPADFTFFLLLNESREQYCESIGLTGKMTAYNGVSYSLKE